MFSDKKPPLTWIIQDTSSISSSRYTHAQIKHITTRVQLDCSVLTLHMLNLDSIQICWTDTGVLSISGSSNTCMYRRLFWHAMKLGRISNNFLKFCELTACEWEITMWHFIGGRPNFQEPLCAQLVNLVHCQFHLPMMQGISLFSVDFYMQCNIALEIFAIFDDNNI